jgi:Holliday junction resolvase RusA-like endonuclease
MQNNKNWRLLQLGEFPEEILSEFTIKCPRADVIRPWVIQQYRSQCTQSVQLDEIDHADLVQWLIFQQDILGFEHFERKWPRLEHILFGTYSEKVGIIAQRHCQICIGGHPIDDLFPSSLIPIRITPISRQATKSLDWRAFQAAVRTRFTEAKHGLAADQPICLSLTFVLSEKNQDRDLDNLTKAMQDAIARALVINDRHIHHLDVVKLIYPETEEYVYINIAPSFLNTHKNVVVPIFHHTWAGQQVLELSDYRPPE